MLGIMNQRLTHAILVLICLQICPADTPIPNSRDQVVIRGRPIKLPAPTGFERADGLDLEVDRLRNDALPASNRYVARFEPLKTNTADLGRSMDVQVMRSLESREIGDRTFSEVKEQTKAELDRARASIEQDLAKATGNAEKALQAATTADAALSVSDVAVLGYFGNEPSSLGFTMAMKVAAQAGSSSTEAKLVVASIIVPVNGRLIYLYANADFRSEVDREWAESAATAWRDAIMVTNPRVEGPPAKTWIFDGSLRAGLIGALLGGVAWLFGWRPKKKAS